MYCYAMGRIQDSMKREESLVFTKIQVFIWYFHEIYINMSVL